MSKNYIQTLTDELEYIKTSDYDILSSNELIFNNLKKKIDDYGYNKYLTKFKQFYGKDYEKINSTLEHLYKICINDKNCGFDLNKYLVAFTIAFDKIEKYEECDVIDIYLKNTTIIFIMYYYYFKNFMYGDIKIQNMLNFYEDYNNAYSFDRNVNKIINKTYELTRCNTNVVILRDILFGNLRYDAVENKSDLITVNNIDSYINIASSPSKKKVYFEMNFVSPVFDHIFCLVKSYDRVENKVKFQLVQSYFYEYCPVSKNYSVQEFKIMMKSLNSLFYNNDKIPYKKKYNFLTESDAFIWERYFQGDIRKYVGKFSKLYCWYNYVELNNLIYAVMGYITDLVSIDTLKILEISADEWKKIYNSTKANYDNSGSVVFVTGIVSTDTFYNDLFKSFFVKSLNIIKKLLTNNELLNMLRNVTAYNKQYINVIIMNTVQKSVDNDFITTIYSVLKKNQTTKIDKNSVFDFDKSKNYLLDEIIKFLIFTNKTKLPEQKIAMRYKKIPEMKCYDNINVLINSSKTNLLPLIEALNDSDNRNATDSRVEKFKQLMNINSESAIYFYNIHFIEMFDKLVNDISHNK